MLTTYISFILLSILSTFVGVIGLIVVLTCVLLIIEAIQCACEYIENISKKKKE